MQTEKQRLYLNTEIEQIKKFCGRIRLPNALIAFTLKTMSFWSLYGMAFYGWLNKYTTHTSFVGVIAFYILVLFFPTRKTLNVMSSFCVCFSFLIFSLVIINGNVCVSLCQWIILLIICVATLRIINTKEENKKNFGRDFGRDSDCLNKNGVDFGNAKTIAISASMIMLLIWFFYPYLFLFIFDSYNVGNPYENLESLFAGAALVASATAVVLQLMQLKNEKNTFALQFEFAQKQKIESNLFDCLQKYSALRKECGDDNIDAIYKIIKDLYEQINNLWEEKNHSIESDLSTIVYNIDRFNDFVSEKYALDSPLKIYMKAVESAQINNEDKSRYYSWFVDMLPSKERAILLTCLFCKEHSYDNTSFYSMKKASMCLLFNESDERNNSTETFIDVVGSVICCPYDERNPSLYEHILEIKNKHENRHELYMKRIMNQFSKLPSINN